MVRSVLAVTAGLLSLTILTYMATVAAILVLFSSSGNTAPTPFYLSISAFYTAFFAILAGYITASVSKETPQRDIAILSLVVFIYSIVMIFLRTGQQPIWYTLLLVIVIPMAILTGGQIKIGRIKREEDSRYN